MPLDHILTRKVLIEGWEAVTEFMVNLHSKYITYDIMQKRMFCIFRFFLICLIEALKNWCILKL